MQAKYFTSVIAAVSLSSSTCALASQAVNADYNKSEHQWMSKQPVDSYWQAPNFNFPSPAELRHLLIHHHDQPHQ